MAQAKKGDTVKVNYTGRLPDGTVFDTSEGGEPMEFTLGEGRLIQGFEDAVEGMEPGETQTVDISPDRAYGMRHNDLVIVVDRNQLPPGVEPTPGDMLELRSPDGDVALATVTDVSGKSITLDANHPLAGHDLTFDIELLEIE